MTRKFELGGSFECLIPTQAFGNKTIFLHFKEIIEAEVSDSEISELQKKMVYEKCINPAREIEQEILVECIQREMKHLRILKCPACGKHHPSITTIRDFDKKDFYVDEGTLERAAAFGMIQDLKGRHYIKTGDWKPAKELDVCWPYLAILKGSPELLEVDQFDFPKFLKKYEIKDMKCGEREWDCENEITFEPDFFGTPVGDWADNVPSVFDWKRNVEKVSAFTQMSISAKKFGLSQMIAIPVNGETQQGFSKPVISKDTNGYLEIALDKRRKFRRRYSI